MIRSAAASAARSRWFGIRLSPVGAFARHIWRQIFASSLSIRHLHTEPRTKRKEAVRLPAAWRDAVAIAPTGHEIAAEAENRKTGGADLPWPSERAGFYALFCILFGTFMSFFDQTVFAMLAEEMKAS